MKLPTTLRVLSRKSFIPSSTYCRFVSVLLIWNALLYFIINVYMYVYVCIMYRPTRIPGIRSPWPRTFFPLFILLLVHGLVQTRGKSFLSFYFLSLLYLYLLSAFLPYWFPFHPLHKTRLKPSHTRIIPFLNTFGTFISFPPPIFPHLFFCKSCRYSLPVPYQWQKVYIFSVS
jgi:hypothetical protein